MNKRLIILIVLIVLSIGVGVLNTYLYFSKVQNLQNSIIALQNEPQPKPTVIQGPQGVSGVQGLQGIAGPSGPQGLTGVQGQTGQIGTPGVNGQQGPVGPQGPKGDTGSRGEPGVNGREIQLRCVNNQVQYRYDGDFFWQTLYTLGITESCL